MTDLEFVSTTGIQHRLDRLLGLLLEPGNGLTECGLRVDLSNLVVQQPVRKCKRCYPTAGA